MSHCIAVVAGFLQPHNKKAIEEKAAEHGCSVRFYTRKRDAVGAIDDCEIVFGECFDDVMRSATGAKWIAHSWAGVNTICSPEFFPNPGCLLTNSNVYGVTIAEHLIMQSLMLMRRYPEASGIIRDGEWHHFPGMIHSLFDSRITVLGTGDIGTEFARRARAFCPASITGLRRDPGRRNPAFDRILGLDALDSVLPETDLLIMCLPETPATTGLMEGTRLALLPRGAFLVNVGRGSAIDQPALIEALNSGRLGGAALDVVTPEPLPADDPLRSAKNLILTPHCAGTMNLPHTIDLAVDRFCENLDRYFAGQPLNYLVNRELGY